MELKKESIQVLRKKSHARSQITFDEDFNVPDAKPDVGRLIQHKGRIIMEDVRLTDGKGILTGNLEADVLYVGEERGIVSSLTVKLPFEETLNLKNITNGDKMCLKWEIEDLAIRLIHSRKLNIKALVTFAQLWMRRIRSGYPLHWIHLMYLPEKNRSAFWDLAYIKKTPCGSRMNTPLLPIGRIFQD